MNKRKNIIIIDDDKSILSMWARIFKGKGYDVDTAETGREAEEKAYKGYDLALIDVMLPDMDGVELLKRMQKTHPQMKKIVITGFASLDKGVKALDEGADAYLAKPVNPEELLSIVKQKLQE